MIATMMAAISNASAKLAAVTSQSGAVPENCAAGICAPGSPGEPRSMPANNSVRSPGFICCRSRFMIRMNTPRMIMF